MSTTEHSRMTTDNPLFEIKNLQKNFQVSGGGLLSGLFDDPDYLSAVDDLTFDVKQGEILGIAGQSGCGKSTLGELLVRLQQPTDGQILFKGRDLTKMGSDDEMAFRRECQVIFQDPYEALNPRFTVAQTVEEPLTIHGIGNREEREAKTMESLEVAGLRPPEKFLNKLPTELSGGERQRVCIARALVLDPDFLLADEPVSMLDVSVKTGVLELFERLQAERDMTMVYISHDLSTINYLADRTMIMYMGNAVELGETEKVIHETAHPYTEQLLAAVPDPDPDVKRKGSRMGGEVPDPVNRPKGCRFHPQCQYKTEQCTTKEPVLDILDDDHDVACYHPVDR